jgi:hypothetical protein
MNYVRRCLLSLSKIKSQKLNAIRSEPSIADSLRNGLQ